MRRSSANKAAFGRKTVYFDAVKRPTSLLYRNGENRKILFVKDINRRFSSRVRSNLLGDGSGNAFCEIVCILDPDDCSVLSDAEIYDAPFGV